MPFEERAHAEAQRTWRGRWPQPDESIPSNKDAWFAPDQPRYAMELDTETPGWQSEFACSRQYFKPRISQRGRLPQPNQRTANTRELTRMAWREFRHQ